MKWTLGFLPFVFATLTFGAEPREFIPNGSVVAKVMQMVLSPRGEELAARLQHAVSKNRDWWLEHVKSATPGQPLAYDSRMGLTEVEYDEYLELASKPSLGQVKEVPLNFRWSSEAQVVLDGQDSLPDLTGVRIDLISDSVTTDYGVLAERSEINNASTDSPTGPWRGVQWKLESVEANSTSGVVAKLALGRLSQSGEGILYFDAKKVEGGALTRKSSIILFYSLP